MIGIFLLDFSEVRGSSIRAVDDVTHIIVLADADSLAEILYEIEPVLRAAGYVVTLDGVVTRDVRINYTDFQTRVIPGACSELSVVMTCIVRKTVLAFASDYSALEFLESQTVDACVGVSLHRMLLVVQ